MTVLKSFFSRTILLTAILVVPTLSSAQVYTPIDSSYVLTFDEEFNGTSVDASKWGTNWLGSPGAITKPINGGEIAAYDPAQVSVSGGYLRLAAINKTVTATDGKTYNHVSGIVQSYRKFEQAFGYIEARVYLPGSNGKIHNFPAFWMNGDHARYGQSWPHAGELDIVEGLSGSAQYHFHSPTTHDGGGPGGNFTGWHIYAALWEPGSVTFYYDGVMVGKMSSGITSFPMYLILNNGISPQYGGAMVVPSTMMVDYVHVYSRDSAAVPVAPQPGYGGPGDTGGSTPPPADTAAPSVPTSLAGQALSQTQIRINWAASSDNVAVTGYRVYRNGSQVGSVSATTFTDSGLTAGTRYTYTVRAFDAAGNLSNASASLDVTTQNVVVTPTPTPTPVPTPTPSPSPTPTPPANSVVVNPSFESSSLSPWTTKGNAQVQINSSSTPSYEGAKSAFISGSGAAFEQVITGLAPNTTYKLSAYVRRGTSSSNVALGVKDFGRVQVAMSASSTSYRKITISFTTGASNTTARIFFYANSGNGRADKFELSK